MTDSHNARRRLRRWMVSCLLLAVAPAFAAETDKNLEAAHGIVCRLANTREGYFGWPSVARTEDGTLIVASSGLRTQHICPYGKTVLNVSTDDGKTWSPPRVINDSPIDDRDAGIVSLGGGKLLVSWFTSDTRVRYYEGLWKRLRPAEQDRWERVFDSWADEMVQKHLGSWVMLSDNGGKDWGEPIAVPVSTPHGPIVLADGGLLYLGKRRGGEGGDMDLRNREIRACRSDDGGRTWQMLGEVGVAEGTRKANYHEPHVVELPDGRLIGMIRFQFSGDDDPAKGDHISFSLYQTESDDGGRTWTPARPTGVYGSPPHLIRHSSGKLICVYGYRKGLYGQRVMISADDGKTWDADWILRDDGPSHDLGYPASVEMPDGSILTVYYQKVDEDDRCSLLWSRWKLP